jgi:hypothetical protein
VAFESPFAHELAAFLKPAAWILPPFTAASTVAESWIPKSAANVKRTDKPQIPHGFRQVPPSRRFNFQRCAWLARDHPG